MVFLIYRGSFVKLDQMVQVVLPATTSVSFTQNNDFRGDEKMAEE